MILAMDGHLFQHLHEKTLSIPSWSVQMRLSPHALTSLYNIEKIQLRMMVSMFNGNPAQQSFLATVLPMLVMKWTSSPSIMSYTSL